jgi:hypothetical protein
MPRAVGPEGVSDRRLQQGQVPRRRAVSRRLGGAARWPEEVALLVAQNKHLVERPHGKALLFSVVRRAGERHVCNVQMHPLEVALALHGYASGEVFEVWRSYKECARAGEIRIERHLDASSAAFTFLQRRWREHVKAAKGK